MKSLLITLLIFSTSPLIAQNELQGRYQGALTRDGSVQLLSFNFHLDGSITYEIPEAGFYDVPVSDFEIKEDTIYIQFYYGNFFLFMNDNGTEITGISEGWKPKLRIHLKKTATPKAEFAIEQMTFNNNQVALSGMLYHPITFSGKSKKYIVLIHGSGEQDRYSPYYISLGNKLAKQGYGVLLFDKRGSGKSTGSHDEASLIDLSDDAIAALEYLQNRPDLEISQMGLLGTSQGGWVSTIAANQTALCDFLIFNVGPSVSLFDQDVHRVEYGMLEDGWSPEAIDSAVAYTQLYFNYAKSQKSSDWRILESSIEAVKNKPWEDYLNLPENKTHFGWWIENSYDPANDLSNVKCPVLSIFGELDVLVPPAENESLMRKYLAKSGVDFQLIVVPEVGHNMKSFQGLNGDNWNWPHVYWNWRKEPIEFMKNVSKFLKQL